MSDAHFWHGRTLALGKLPDEPVYARIVPWQGPLSNTWLFGGREDVDDNSPLAFYDEAGRRRIVFNLDGVHWFDEQGNLTQSIKAKP